MFRVFTTSALAGLAALLPRVVLAGDGPLPHELQDVRADRIVRAVTANPKGERR